MQFLKEKLRLVPNLDQNIKITLSSNNNLNGLQQSIDDVIEKETGLSINPADDGEKFRYSPLSAYTLTLIFNLSGTTGSSYQLAGFSSSDITSRTEAILRSFYVMQVYDSTVSENQTLLHTGFFNGFNFLNYNTGQTIYSDFISDEFVSLYLPQWFIESLSGESTTLYSKISFYNGKTGKLDIFHGGTGTTATTEADFYFNILLDPDNFLYQIGNVIGIEITNSDYIDKMNNTLNSFNIQTPAYPLGTKFNNTGTYD